MSENVYKPFLMEIVDIKEEAPNTKTFKLNFKKPEEAKKFSFKAGQFGLYSAFGSGESTFCIASSPTRKDYIECTFRIAGRVTTQLANMNIGDTLGFRGPYGNSFPIEEKFYGKNITFVAGGIGLPPVRCLIWNTLDLRDKFKDVNIVYGARTYQDLVYKNELNEWEKREDVNLITTVDPGGEKPENGCTVDWKGHVGFVPTVLEESNIKGGKDSVAIVCGPPIMIKFTLAILEKMGFSPENIYTTLENKMKCGIGKCGRCNVGNFYVCKHGPVINLADLSKLPQEY